MGQDRNGRAGHPWGRMARVFGSGGGTCNAASQITSTFQAGDHGRGTSVGWGPNLQAQVQDAVHEEARQHGCGKFQEAGLEILSAEDGARPPRAVPPMDEEPPPPLSAGSVSARRKHGIISSRSARRGRLNRRSCGRRW